MAIGARQLAIRRHRPLKARTEIVIWMTGPGQHPARKLCGDDLSQTPAAGRVEQRIRYVNVPGGRVACSTMGSGPALVIPPGWFGQLDVELESEPLRSFYEVFAAGCTVVRYDRLGTGLSDRHRPAWTLTLESEVDVVEVLVEELGLGRCSLFGFSYGGCIAAGFAVRRPDRTDRLLVYGGYAQGAGIAPVAVRESMASMLRAHWGLGSRVMTEVFIPDGDRDVARWFARLQRESVTGELAATFLEMSYQADLRPVLGAVRPPTLIMHRRGDRAIPFELGRQLAALIAGARFEPLVGRWHQPWLGDTGSVLRLACRFLGIPAPEDAAATLPRAKVPTLTARETQVLRLVAEGLNDAEIAQRLVLSPHTVHRHVANIRTRLGQPSRAAAAAQAARLAVI